MCDDGRALLQAPERRARPRGARGARARRAARRPGRRRRRGRRRRSTPHAKAGHARRAPLAGGLARGPPRRRARWPRRRSALREVFVGGRADGWQDDFLKRADQNPNRKGLELVAQALGLAVRPVADLAAAVAAGQGEGDLGGRRRDPGRGRRPEARRRRGARRPGVQRRACSPGTPRCCCPPRRTPETDGTFVNFEGRAQRFEMAYFPRGEARPHWALAAELGARARARPALRERARRLRARSAAGSAPPLGDFRWDSLPSTGQAVRHRPARRGHRRRAARGQPRPRAGRHHRGLPARHRADVVEEANREPSRRNDRLVIAGLLVGLVGPVVRPSTCSPGPWRCGFAALGLPPAFGAAVANLLTLMLVVLMISASLLTVAERKWSALMQDRIGANRIRVFGSALGGIPFLIADALKMLTKERFRPAAASKFLFNLAPVLSFAPVFALFAVVPVGPQLPLRDILDGAGRARAGRDRAAGRHPGRRPALPLRHRLARGLRHLARRLGLEQQARPARRRARLLADDQLRGVARPVARRDDDRLPHPAPRADGGRAGRGGARPDPRARACSCSRSASSSSSPAPSPRRSARPSTSPRARARSSATSSSTPA